MKISEVVQSYKSFLLIHLSLQFTTNYSGCDVKMNHSSDKQGMNLSTS